MKKIILALIPLVLFQVIVQAQQAGKKVVQTSKVIKKDTNENNNAFIPQSGLVLLSDMDQRAIYHWDNGQSSTVAGRQAGDPSAKYARVFGDSAIVVKDWDEKIKTASNGTVKH